MTLTVIVLGTIAATCAAVGIGKSVKAGVDIHDAKKTNKKASDIVESAKFEMNNARRECNENLQKLGQKKVEILNTSIKHFVESFGKLKNVDFQNSIGIDESNKLRLETADFKELKQLSNYATEIAGGVAGGALGGALTAFGAYSAAGALASASTGTAIATLSGAAATNATLAFFGGGAIAAGGGGVMLGTMVLGGLVAGPALAIMGFVVGAKASAEKDKAYCNLAEAQKFAEEVHTASDMCFAIAKRCKMFVDKLSILNIKLLPLLRQLDKAIEENGTDFRLFTPVQKNVTAAAASLAKAIKVLIDTPILTSNGSLTQDSLAIVQQIDSDSAINK